VTISLLTGHAAYVSANIVGASGILAAVTTDICWDNSPGLPAPRSAAGKVVPCSGSGRLGSSCGWQ
jgi:hypothetical protein